MFKNSSSFVISNIDGLGDVTADIQMQRAPFQDGSTFIDSRLDPRYLSFDVFIKGDNDTDISEKRSQLSRVFNPKLGSGLFVYRYGDIVREINATSEHVPTFPTGAENRGHHYQIAMISLVCPDPYWKSPRLTVEPLSPFVEMFEFPSDYWEVGAGGDLFFEVGFEGEIRELIVRGDAGSPVQIKFYGPSTNPVIRNNTTNEFIKVNRTLDATDVLFIDTGSKEVTINGVNVFNWIDINSTFWKLHEGANEIEYTADAGVADARLEIMWNERYIGV